jgi:hypothetical protein
MAFCSSAGRSDELLRRFASLEIKGVENGKSGLTPRAPSAAAMSSLPVEGTSDNSTPTGQKDLSIIIMAMRKLREGIVASHRIDEFSTQAYLFCIRLSILVKHMESYHPALLYLLRKIHPLNPLSRVELQEFVGYLVLDLACRQQDLSQAHVIRRQYSLKDSKVDAILSALAHDNYDLFWKVKKSVDGHKAKLMEFAESGMRIQTLKCLGRTYLTIDLEYLENITNSSWSELVASHSVGWELDGKKVVIRKPKGR